MSPDKARDWRVVELRELLVDGPTNGYSPSSAADAQGTLSLKLSATTQGRLVLNDHTIKHLHETLSPDSWAWLEPGDLLVQRSNTPELVGTAAVFDGPRKTYIYPDLMIRLRFADEATTRWVWRYMNSPYGRRHFESIAAGAAGSMPKINGAKLRAMPIPLPPSSAEQYVAAIADILDKADAVRRKRKEAIALTDELLRSIFLEMFGDPVANPKGFRMVTIGELCERGGSLVDGPFGSSLKPEHYTTDGIRVVRNWNIRDDYFDGSQFKYVTPAKFGEIRRSAVRPGDILITTKGTVGDVCLMPDLPGPSVLSASGTVRLTLPPTKELLGPVVVWQMILPSYKRYLHSFEAGSAQQYLNLTGIKKMRLVVPPAPEQAKFVTLREAVGRMKGLATAGVLAAEDLFSSLVARAFRGELENQTQLGPALRGSGC